MTTCATCNRELPRCAKCGASPWQAKRDYVAAQDVLFAKCACGFAWLETPLDRQEPPAPTLSQEQLVAKAMREFGVEPVEADE